MKENAVLVIATAVITLFAASQATLAVSPCPNPDNCVQVTVTNPTTNAKVGDVLTVGLSFKQAPDNGAAGGPDEIAAMAMTLGMAASGGGVPLVLNDWVAGSDCPTTADGLPTSVHPDASISNLRVVIENASCGGGRTHCLCPDAGQTQDNFINIVIFGPNPLPTPGPTPIAIPTLPAGPQLLLTIDLKVNTGASGTIPLHIFNQVQDSTSTQPQFTALLSVGDRLAVDQTCVPVEGSPPCSDPAAVSQVVTTDASVSVTGSTCCGDSNGNNSISTSEATNAVLALINRDVTKNPAADCNDHNGQVSTSEATKVILNLVNRTCTP